MPYPSVNAKSQLFFTIWQQHPSGLRKMRASEYQSLALKRRLRFCVGTVDGVSREAQPQPRTSLSLRLESSPTAWTSPQVLRTNIYASRSSMLWAYRLQEQKWKTSETDLSRF